MYRKQRHRTIKKKGDYVQADRDNIIIVVGTHIDHHFTGASVNDYFTKLYTIKDLKDGKVAVENDGTVEDIVKVIKHVFNAKVDGNAKYYFENDGWDAHNRTGLPTQSVKDFLAQLLKKEEAWTPKVGEKVQCKFYSESSLWVEAEYLASDKGSKYSYAVVVTDSNGDRVIESVAKIRQILKKVKVTKQRVADILGIELDQLEIID